MIPEVVASETGRAHTDIRSSLPAFLIRGCGTYDEHGSDSSGVNKRRSRGTALESAAEERDSPVAERTSSLVGIPSTVGTEDPRGNPGGPSPKAKHSLVTDSGTVP